MVMEEKGETRLSFEGRGLGLEFKYYWETTLGFFHLGGFQKLLG